MHSIPTVQIVRQGRAGQGRAGQGGQGRAGQDIRKADSNNMHAKLHTKAPCLPNLSSHGFWHTLPKHLKSLHILHAPHAHPAALFKTETSILSQKRHPYTGNLNSGTSGDTKNAFLHCGDVSALYSIPKRLFYFRNVIHTLAISIHERVETLKRRVSTTQTPPPPHNLWTSKVSKAAVTSSVTSSALILPSPSPYRLPACRKWATV